MIFTVLFVTIITRDVDVELVGVDCELPSWSKEEKVVVVVL